MEYKQYGHVPEREILEGILFIHQQIFQDGTLPEKAEAKEKVLFLVAMDGEQVVGYKIGYETSADQFYSWYGAVHPYYRGQGLHRSS